MEQFGLKDLSEQTALNNKKQFDKFIALQVERYEQWQAEASKGFDYIPRRLQIALKTAVDAYNWTGKEIAKDSMLIYREQLKPSKRKMVKLGLKRKLNV